jgi:hypothetical protein
MEKSSPRDERTSGGSSTNPEVAHETSDVSVPDIAKFGVGLIIIAIVTHILMWGLYKYFAAQEPYARTAGQAREQLPPEPRLQGAPGHEIHPVEELNSMRAAENSVLTTYAWVAQANGTARIPIEQAIKMLAERGLPSRSGVYPQSMPNDSKSGRSQKQ